MTKANPSGAETFLDELKHPGLVSAIDLARWLAATVVMLSHARFPLLKGYGLLEPAERPIWAQAWYFLTGYEMEAVLVFFVLSGFLVGGMVCARVRQGKFDPGGYAIDRFGRLYTAFFPALLLTLVLTWAGLHWFNGTGLYDGTNATFAQKDTAFNFAANLGWQSFVANLAMVQFYFVEPYGANPPLWTLSSEFWFYATFGLGATALISSGARRLVCAAIALLAAIVLGPLFWYYLAIWLVGVVAAVVPRPRVKLALPALALLAVILLFRRTYDPVLSQSNWTHYGSLFATCVAMGLVLVGWRSQPPKWSLPLARMNLVMADFSYSLYLTHYPVLILAVAVLGSVSGQNGFESGFAPTDPWALGTYIGTVSLCMAFAWIFAQATEKQTPKVRRWLKQKLLAR